MSCAIDGLQLLDPACYSISQFCFLCGAQPANPKPFGHCHICGNTFCRPHLPKLRPEPSNPENLHPFCAKCEENFVAKQVFEDFARQKATVEFEISGLRQQNLEYEEEIQVKFETIDGIRRNKSKVIEKLTNEALTYGQEIEEITQENKSLERDLMSKNQEKDTLLKEIEKVDSLIREMTESLEERSGYEYVFGEGLLKRKDIQNRKKTKWQEGISGCCGKIC